MHGLDFTKVWEVLRNLLRTVYHYVLGKVEEAE